MTCHNCRTECKRKGRDRKGNQRYQCRQCSEPFLETVKITLTACAWTWTKPRWF